MYSKINRKSDDTLNKISGGTPMLQRVLFVLLSAASLSAIAAETVLKLYRPFGEAVEQVSPVPTVELAGICIGQSQLILREDAWRCQVDNTVFDPCFIKAGAQQQQLICPKSPWTSEGVAIHVATPLDNEQHIGLDMSRTWPWAIELSNGDYCQAVSATQTFDSMPVRYQCSNDNVLIGHLQRCKAPWSMLEKTAAGVITAELTKAWF